MPARISTAWRALRTGVAFAAFGLMSVWLGHVWLPFRGLWDRKTPSWRRGQRAIHNAYRIHAWLMISLRLIEVRWIGADRLHTPGRKLLVANHPSLIDTALIVSRLPQADCIVGRDYSENPLLRGAVRAADYISNDLPPAEIVRVAARYLAEDRILLIYPEGTRSPEGGLGRFQRGAAHIALETGLDMLPIYINVDPPSLMKGQKWYDVPPRPPVWTFRVGEPLVAKDYLDGTESSVMAARKLTIALRERFEARSLDATE
jgi:1-acyl-sn-glycerol-3-phosphate acyltransferase